MKIPSAVKYLGTGVLVGSIYAGLYLQWPPHKRLAEQFKGIEKIRTFAEESETQSEAATAFSEAAKIGLGTTKGTTQRTEEIELSIENIIESIKNFRNAKE